MEPTTLSIVIVALALIFGGQAVWRNWLNNRKEERIAESRNKTMVKALETIQKFVDGNIEKDS